VTEINSRQKTPTKEDFAQLHVAHAQNILPDMASSGHMTSGSTPSNTNLIKHYCSENYRRKTIIIKASKWNEEFNISREECDFMSKHELILMYYLTMEHKRKLQ
jgi:hypothetical protein